MLDKSFAFAEAEQRLYKGWEDSGAFAAGGDRSNAAPFTIMIPPPNVTGSLHVGHALNHTIQDTLIRWRRMQGQNALWQPGTDHAGIATQMVVERLLSQEGKTRQSLGRDAFLERVWQWRGESGGTIIAQLRRLGASLDWQRERFTMDDGLSAAVRRVFVALHAEGKIYRDRRLVNWDPNFQSAISDLEVESKEVRGHLWHIAYRIDGADEHLTVATTRPETMLADTAIAVHPDDARYKHLVGWHAIVPLIGRRIPIVADAYSDPEKGTGAVKITPAHDFNDFAVGQRHGLPMPSMLDPQARVTLEDIASDLTRIESYADPDFVRSLAGFGRESARASIVAELDRLQLLQRTEPHTHQVPHGDRSGAVIEPRLTIQWYCDAKALAGPAIAAVEEGRTVFVPKQWENTFFAWMRDIEPWCISRQLWWGHRIPAWYAPDGRVFVAETATQAQAEADAHFGEPTQLTQDEDVLDTWFSSALWPFSTLGWPETTPELARHYPNDVLVTAFDIIFFWVARMMMMGLHFMGDVPFHTVAIHGLVRDERGQKMSKSKGNVIDPLALIDEYGADALRFAVCQLAGPGRDIKLGPARVAEARTFITKLWNAARFCQMNEVTPVPGFDPATAKNPLCLWLLAEAARAVAAADAALAAYRFDDYANVCTRFTWNIFCDWFLELSKPVLFGTDEPAKAELRAAAAHVLGIILRVLHPSVPFVTETLWDDFGYGPPLSLIRAPWPTSTEIVGWASAHHPDTAAAEINWVIDFITAIRTVRSEMNIPPSIKTPVLLENAAPETWACARRWEEPASRLARISEIALSDGTPNPGSAQIILGEATIILPLAGLIDLDAERARIERDRTRATAELEKVLRKLENSDFVARAKPEVVEENRERERRFREEIERLTQALARLH
jgi:valyl-tRNA synthetase